MDVKVPEYVRTKNFEINPAIPGFWEKYSTPNSGNDIVVWDMQSLSVYCPTTMLIRRQQVSPKIEQTFRHSDQ